MKGAVSRLKWYACARGNGVGRAKKGDKRGRHMSVRVGWVLSMRWVMHVRKRGGLHARQVKVCVPTTHDLRLLEGRCTCARWVGYVMCMVCFFLCVCASVLIMLRVLKFVGVCLRVCLYKCTCLFYIFDDVCAQPLRTGTEKG